MLTPGTYRIAELTSKLNRSRRAVERYIEKHNLETTEIDYNNRPVAGVVLDEEAIEKLMTHIAPGSEPDTYGTDPHPIPCQYPTDNPGGEVLELITQERDSLLSQLEQTAERVKALETENTRLAELSEKDKTIQESQKETIMSLKTSVALLRQQNEQLEAKLNPTINLIPEQPKRGLWNRLIAAFSGG